MFRFWKQCRNPKTICPSTVDIITTQLAWIKIKILFYKGKTPQDDDKHWQSAQIKVTVQNFWLLTLTKVENLNQTSAMQVLSTKRAGALRTIDWLAAGVMLCTVKQWACAFSFHVRPRSPSLQLCKDHRLLSVMLTPCDISTSRFPRRSRRHVTQHMHEDSLECNKKAFK